MHFRFYNNNNLRSLTLTKFSFIIKKILYIVEEIEISRKITTRDFGNSTKKTKLKYRFNYNVSNLLQKVYLRERPHDVPEAAKMSWWLPVVIAQESTLDLKDTTPAAWMKDRSPLTIPNIPDKDKFIIVNPEEIGKFVTFFIEINFGYSIGMMTRNEN